MKNPNGYGTVTKLSGNRRRPFVVREGKTGKQKIIGYAATREEALIILAQYNKAPWDIKNDKITLQQLFDLWLEKRAIKLQKSNFNGLKSAYKHCKSLADMQYKQLKAYHMQECIDNCGFGYSTQRTIKNLFVHLDKFAMELDIISKCYSELLTSAPALETTSRTIFTEEEVNLLWQKEQMDWVDSILFLLYTDFRISEMLDLKTENVDMEKQTMRSERAHV